MSIRTHGRPKRCPHCDEWLVTPEQAKQQRKHARKFICIWTIVMCSIIFGSIAVSTVYQNVEHENYLAQFERLAWGKIVDINYIGDGCYEIYFATILVDGVGSNPEKHILSFKDSVKAMPVVDQCCVFYGHGHQIQYIEYISGK